MPDATPAEPLRRRRAGRPVQAVLTPKKITAAALKVIARNGYQGLTMQHLAAALNVAPSALYNHVKSKQQVLLLVEDALMGRVDVSSFESKPWDQAVIDWAHSYRSVFSKHTPLIPVIALMPVTNAPQTITMYQSVVAGFLRGGWKSEHVINAIVALESFIYGSAYDVNAPADIFDPGELGEGAPDFAAAVTGRSRLASTNDADAAFELGLTALVAGLGATLRSSGS